MLPFTFLMDRLPDHGRTASAFLMSLMSRCAKWPLRDPDRQGRSLDQLQHQRPRAVGFLDAVDGGDVRVVEAGEDLRFPLEPREPIRLSREGVGQDLQRDLAVELGVGGLPDQAHAPLADEGGHVVVPKAVADLKCHQSRRSVNCKAVEQAGPSGRHQIVL
jgi:hypothetical protein